MFLDKPDMLTPPNVDYGAPGFDEEGVMVLFGGDHGAGACPCMLKLNFSSPVERKNWKELNYWCPTVQIASIDCSKDSFELLSNTIMPMIRTQLIQLRESCVTLVYSARTPSIYRKAFLVPKTFVSNSVTVHHNLLSCGVGIEQRSIDLSAYFNVEDVNRFTDFRATVVISNFNDLYVGNLAFLAMPLE